MRVISVIILCLLGCTDKVRPTTSHEVTPEYAWPTASVEVPEPIARAAPVHAPKETPPPVEPEARLSSVASREPGTIAVKPDRRLRYTSPFAIEVLRRRPVPMLGVGYSEATTVVAGAMFLRAGMFYGGLGIEYRTHENQFAPALLLGMRLHGHFFLGLAVTPDWVTGEESVQYVERPNVAARVGVVVGFSY